MEYLATEIVRDDGTWMTVYSKFDGNDVVVALFRTDLEPGFTAWSEFKENCAMRGYSIFAIFSDGRSGYVVGTLDQITP